MAAGSFTSLTVTGGQSGALVNFQQTSNTGHALTAYLNATGGTSQAAINAVSNNAAFSAMEVTGCETAHGTVKIAHVGYHDGSDANAAAVSIDLQTAGSTTGTKAQGVFITSTTDALPAGNVFNARLNGQDYFVVKGGNSPAGRGVVGVGIPIGHLPTGMVEVVQKDATTPALALTGAGGTVTIQVDASGNLTATMPSGAVRALALD